MVLGITIGTGAVVMWAIMMVRNSMSLSTNGFGRRSVCGRTARWNRKVR